MIKGYILKITFSNNLLSHKLYGKVISKITRTNKQYYYSKGMLHNTLFTRLTKGTIFVENIDSIDFDEINKYGNVVVVKQTSLNDEYELTTGKDYWVNKYKKKQVKIIVSRKNK